MNALIRTAGIAMIVGLPILCFFALRLAYSPRDFQQIRRGEELQRLERATFRHKEARRQAVQEWIAQRRTLAETMQRFQELERERPDYVTTQRGWLPSDEERHYRLIITYVEESLQGRPEELAAVLHRLEKDYQQLQAAAITEQRPSESGYNPAP